MNEHDLAGFYFTEAENHFRLGNIDKAIKLVTESIELNETEEYYIFRSLGHTTAAHIAQSIDDANHAINLNKANPEALFCRAEAYFYAGEFELALVDYQLVSSMRENDARDPKGVNKCVDCIRKATCAGLRDNDLLMQLLEDGILVESYSNEPKGISMFSRYVLSDTTPLETSISELMTQYIETEQPSKLEKRTFFHTNYCHVTQDKIFLENTELCRGVDSDVKNAISYIENRETFWRNQNKTRTFRETQRINKATKTIDDRNEAIVSQRAKERSERIKAEAEENSRRRPMELQESSVLRPYIDADYKKAKEAKDNFAAGRYNEAIHCIESLQIRGLDSELLRAKALFKLKKFNEAGAVVTELVEGCEAKRMCDAKNEKIMVDALALRSLALKALGDIDEAIIVLKICMKYAEEFSDDKAAEFCTRQSREMAKMLRKQAAG